jgi:hypothetical protein
MKPKHDAKITKGIIFAGCSFTWGQGLYYYSNLNTLQEPPPDQYNPDYLTESHIEFMKTVRYPRLVANHFNTFEFVHPRNGGSNHGAVAYWRACLNTKNKHEKIYNDRIRPIDYSEISHIVFQLTQWQRDNFDMHIDGETHNIPYFCVGHDQYREKFFRWLDKQGMSMNTWTEMYIQRGLDDVKLLLQDCENNGVKATIFTWPSEYLKYIEKDPWLKERLLTFEYKNKTYNSIEDLMWPGTMQNKGYNPELTVKWDEDNFEETPKDHHPSIACHRVMADNVIKRIERLSL